MMGARKRFAVIDLGTNSVRCDVYEKFGLSTPHLMLRLREMVRLGDGVYSSGRASKAAIDRTVDAFEYFARVLKDLQVSDVMAVATSASRSAKNKQEIVAAIYNKSSIRIKIISGKDEATLIANGILAVEYLEPGPFALIDIGGGSTELSICRKDRVLFSCSLPLGANRLRQDFLGPSKNFHSRLLAAHKMKCHVHQTLSRYLKQSPVQSVDSIIGSSGTIRAIKKVIKQQGLPGNPFKRWHVSIANEWLLSMNKSEYLALPGMEERRMDLILPGSLLLEQLMYSIGAKRVFQTERSLRNGLMLKALEEF